MSNPIYALILAGGSGERFWPLSRRNRPKQLLRLVSERTLLEKTIARLEGLVPSDRILILTNVDQEKAVRDLLKAFPKQNIIAEPAKRDTAAAAEETGALVIIGIKPTWACPGFGYIEQGEQVRLHGEGKIAVHRVVRFREKPNVDLAESFLRKGNFRWNAGMFVWSVPTVLSEFNRHAPELAHFISQVRSSKDLDKTLRERFEKLPRISFDYAIMEKAERVLVVEASFDWDDVGSWQTVARYFKKDEHGNATNSALTALDSSDNIIFNEGETTIALLGVHNLIIIRTGDAILICHRHQAEKIKNLVGKLPPELQ